MSATSAFLEGLIDKCGGFSRFQWTMFCLMVYSKGAVTWTMLMMTFAGATPEWRCLYTNYTIPGTNPSISTNHTHYVDEQCYPTGNATAQKCLDYTFSENMNTIVNEWTLICDRDWIASTTTTIQMVGLIISSVVSGHLADLFGRKPTYFLSLASLTVFNVIAGFSTSWEMFAALRFLLGCSIGANITVFFNYLIEFIPAKRRSLVIAFPAWALWACAFGLVSMWLHDWRILHFATAVLTLPCVFMWWFLPESFRYLVTRNRLNDAKGVVFKIARINGRPEPDMSKMSYFVKMDLKVDADRKYTIFDVAKSPKLRKYTCLLGITWMSCGYGFYAISFGVQNLSGSLYLNMFLLSVVEIPGDISSFFLSNRFGRQRSTFTLLLVSGILGFVVAALQVSALEMKNSLINGFALASKTAVAIGWATLIILTTELYPTVVRNIGYGMLNTCARVGAMVAPQIVYLNKHIPGAMYFVFGGSLVLSALSVWFVEETNKKPIKDGLTTKTTAGEEMQSLQTESDV